ncbi:hypothetical protein Tco_1449220 [Tanacetum coccineum]
MNVTRPGPYSVCDLIGGVTDWYQEPSIPSEDPYEEAARQLLEQAPRSPEYVPDPMELGGLCTIVHSGVSDTP